jgi:ParB-like chromosome segregation protein Spo0J
MHTREPMMVESPPSLEIHEVCEIFPMMPPEQFVGLRADIEEHGQRDPIWVWQGKVIDGRNRLKACEQLGIDPILREWDGQGSLVSFVISLNLHRRHLDASQRALIGAKIKAQFEEEARQRQTTSTGGSSPQLLANLPKAGPVHARKLAAETVNVSSRLVEAATKVLDDGIPELASMVQAGEVAVSAAEEVAELDPDEQAEVVAAGPRAVKEKAAKIRNGKKVTRPIEEPDPHPSYEDESQETEADDAPSRPEPKPAVQYLKEDQSDLWSEEPQTRDEAEAHSVEWEARWLKFWGNLSNFLVSLPRRGGVVHLTRNWSRKNVDAAIVRLEDLGKTALKCASELKEARR